jgi:hypothetical protein
MNAFDKRVWGLQVLASSCVRDMHMDGTALSPSKVRLDNTYPFSYMWSVSESLRAVLTESEFVDRSQVTRDLHAHPT